MPVNSARNQLSCCFHQALLVAAVSPHQLLLGFSVSTILWWARIVLRPSSLRSGPDHEFEQWRLKASERKLRTIALRAMSGVEGIGHHNPNPVYPAAVLDKFGVSVRDCR
jgi:hypothetical protein